jgi:putative transposase
MAGKRHASEEISAKLAQADELAAKGKTQREISKALGVSMMTYHRWRKMVDVRGTGGAERHAAASSERSSPDRLATSLREEDELKRLEVENTRLRRLVTDMLLEKLRLEDELRSCQDTPLGRPGKGK